MFPVRRVFWVADFVELFDQAFKIVLLETDLQSNGGTYNESDPDYEATLDVQVNKQSINALKKLVLISTHPSMRHH